MSNRYETPLAVRHDAETLVEDVRSLIQATAEMGDEKIVKARRRLETAIASGRDLLTQARNRAREGAQAADDYVHENPYQAMAVALGVGVLLCVLARRG